MAIYIYKQHSTQASYSSYETMNYSAKYKRLSEYIKEKRNAREQRLQKLYSTKKCYLGFYGSWK